VAGDDGGRARLEGAIVLKLAQLSEGAIPIAACGFVAAENLLEGVRAFAVGDEGCAKGIRFFRVLLVDHGVEDTGFEAVHAALGPIGGDDLLNQDFFLGTDRVELFVIGAGELSELGVFFARNDSGLRGGCVLQSIEAGYGLALIGARTGRLLRVEAVGSKLRWGSHNSTVAGEI